MGCFVIFKFTVTVDSTTSFMIKEDSSFIIFYIYIYNFFIIEKVCNYLSPEVMLETPSRTRKAQRGCGDTELHSNCVPTQFVGTGRR